MEAAGSMDDPTVERGATVTRKLFALLAAASTLAFAIPARAEEPIEPILPPSSDSTPRPNPFSK